jgi:hypothetical protein
MINPDNLDQAQKRHQKTTDLSPSLLHLSGTQVQQHILLFIVCLVMVITAELHSEIHVLTLLQNLHMSNLR